MPKQSKLQGQSGHKRKLAQLYEQCDGDEQELETFMAEKVANAVMFTTKYLQQTPRRATVPCSRLLESVTFQTVTSCLSEKVFCRAFRMYRASFNKLLGKVKHKLMKDEEMGRRSGYPVIHPDMRLGITLRMLAGASYIDICMAFRISTSMVYTVFKETCDILMDMLSLPGLPRTKGGLRRLANRSKTSRKKPNPLSGCVGAIDGITIKIKKPSDRERPAAYYCRKGYYALPVQALVDSTYRFLCFSACCVGSTHDSMAHAVSSLGRYLAQSGLQAEFWIAGDEAYNCDESLIAPFPSSQAPDEQNFNSFLSSLRVHVEQAFGMLVARWRILRSGMEFSVNRNARIVFLFIKLQNFCINNGEQHLERQLSLAERELVRFETREWYKESTKVCDELNRRNLARTATCVSKKRDLLKEAVVQSGLQRPALALAPGGGL